MLDNFEHVLPAAGLVGELLSGCPGLTILATSRGALNLRAEHRVILEPLPPHDAANLFAATARRRDGRFGPDAREAATIDRICERLDRLPLAIELAAARTDLLGLPELAARLNRSLSETGSGARDAPARQQTLQATIEWSYGLLNADQQRTFARLAVFADGCTLAAAESVCHARVEAIQALVDHSLLTIDGDHRYHMLNTIRDYAAGRLEQTGEAEEVRRLHHRFYSELIDAEPIWGSPLHWPRAHPASAFTQEQANIRAAVVWAITHGKWRGWKRE